jgi:hypothetical protein
MGPHIEVIVQQLQSFRKRKLGSPHSSFRLLLNRDAGNNDCEVTGMSVTTLTFMFIGHIKLGAGELKYDIFDIF